MSSVLSRNEALRKKFTEKFGDRCRMTLCRIGWRLEAAGSNWLSYAVASQADRFGCSASGRKSV